ncbi:UNC-50 family-domain-containing protein [Desarmillaria tabescens]|uniref:UNC-50 family-domain-containing protein n=1 Tax=Armillaria tabescens TaxID=1929756 RepID=A0AA39JW10_ARMTA|nr:UNC-50 family-domain-containing protein [Desarmillaria tabescens]KAK0449637.1 UNC-50 family-domain-containing protein [Desarmillaria tabescens]
MDLPTYNDQQGPSASRPSGSISHRVSIIFRRLHRFQQMDFELAAWQLTYLCLAPRRVYRNVYFHKRTHSIPVSAVAWAVIYSYTILEAIQLAFLMIARDYLLTGVVIATLLWFTSNRLLLSPPSHSTPADSFVEWAYAFDVHTNAFFPLYLALYLAQLFLLPIVLKDNWVCLWVGNTLYLAAFAQYTYGIYLGLNGSLRILRCCVCEFLTFGSTALPFLVRSELLLSPLLPLFTAYIISLLGFNVAKHVLAIYFGS